MNPCLWCGGSGERSLASILQGVVIDVECWHCRGTGVGDVLPEPPDENDPPDPLNDWEFTNGKEEE